MTAREKAFAMNNDPVWRAKYRLVEAIIRQEKARKAERETAQLRRRLERLHGRQEAAAGA